MTVEPHRLVPGPTFGFSRVPTGFPHSPTSSVWVTHSGLKVISDVMGPPQVDRFTYCLAVGRTDGSRRPTDDEFAYARQAFEVPAHALEDEPSATTRFVFCPA